MNKTPCQLMAELALHDHTQHYHASIALTPQDTIHLERYRGKSGFFLKKPIITDKMNLNRWQVTWEAIKQDIWGFIGKPVVLTPDLDHPAVHEQEDYRVGNIIDIQLDEVNHIAYQISEIFDEKAQQMILDGKVKFGSPTVLIYSEATRQQRFKGTEYQEDILHRFRPAHDALVEDPAYGKHVDYIPAICTGDGVGCGLKLLTVSASVEYRKRYEATAKRFEKPESYFEDPKIKEQLDIGVIVEMEHTDDKETALNIAKDHLAEYPDYYTRLQKVIPDVPKSASNSHEAAFENLSCKEKYATIKDGSVKVGWDSAQHKLLHVRNLPHSHVCITADGKKHIERSNVSKSGSVEDADIPTYSKSEMGYVDVPPNGPKCGLCQWRLEPNSCGLVEGKIDMIHGCCNAFLEDKTATPKSAEVNDNNTSQLTIVPFVKARLNKRFSAEELANIVGNIMKTRQADGDSCVSKHVRHQMDSHPSMDHDQAIAIAYSECGEGGSVEDELEAVFMPKLADELMKYYKS